MHLPPIVDSILLVRTFEKTAVTSILLGANERNSLASNLVRQSYSL